MIVQHRIGGFQVDRPLERLRRLGILSELEVSPAETVDDIAVIRLQLDRATEHPERLFQIEPLDRPTSIRDS